MDEVLITVVSQETQDGVTYPVTSVIRIEFEAGTADEFVGMLEHDLDCHSKVLSFERLFARPQHVAQEELARIKNAESDGL